MEARSRRTSAGRIEVGLGLALCAAVAAAGLFELIAGARQTFVPAFAPSWLPLAAAVLAAAAIAPLDAWPRVRRVLLWSGLGLMVWAANGLPLDLLRLTPLIPFPIDWPALVRKTLALAAVLVLARRALARPAAGMRARPATWYGYAAFLFALPYPVLRAWWALGGTPGLSRPGAAGVGFAPLILTIPWLLAAALSLLLVTPRPGIPRRLLLVAGWTATAIVAMIGPAAVWSLVGTLIGGTAPRFGDIAPWVFALFYGSWLLWAIAAGAATRSYQLRSDARRDRPSEEAPPATIDAEPAGR